jgi:hypothetical protein
MLVTIHLLTLLCSSADLWRQAFKAAAVFDNEKDVEIDFRVGEGARDRDRRVFTAMMQRNLGTFLFLFIGPS